MTPHGAHTAGPPRPSGIYTLSALFGLLQGGLVPSYAVIVREFDPPQEAGVRVSIVIRSTVWHGPWGDGCRE